MRYIKPDYWTARMHRRLSEPAALLGIGLMNLADDEGRFEADATAIGCALFPKRPLSKGIELCLAELVEVGWIVLYEASLHGEQVALGQILGFRGKGVGPAGQVINRPTKSLLPAPPDDLLTERCGSTHGAVCDGSEQGDVSAPSTVEGGLRGDRIGVERNGMEGSGTRASAPDSHPPEIPSVAEVVAFGGMGSGIEGEYCRWYHEKCETDHRWIKNGRLIDWRLELNRWWRGDQGRWLDGSHVHSPYKARLAGKNGKTSQVAAGLAEEREDLRCELQTMEKGDREGLKGKGKRERLAEISKILGE